MAITRTPIVDDDGSGLTGTPINNAWKQELYNQIDGAIAPWAAATGGWVPVDASGAGLTITFGGTGGTYVKIGPLVSFWIQIFFPGNSNALAAKIGGLPYFVRTNNAAGVQGYGVHSLWLILKDEKAMQPINPTSGASVTNQALSGANIVLTGTYRTD